MTRFYNKKNNREARDEASKLKSELDIARAERLALGEILTSTLHEIRRFSAQLSKHAEKMSREIASEPQLANLAQTIFYTAGMITSRLAFTDMELNPRAIENQTISKSGIYKKFDKAKRLLAEEARAKQLTVRLVGESHVEIDTLPAFELLPFVLLNNAIKYAPTNQEIQILFEKLDRKTCVSVKSAGPLLEKDEYKKIFDKHYRGQNSRNLPGEGLGLYLAKQVCDFHNLSIRAESGRALPYNINGIPYGEFKIVIEFNY